MPDPRVCSPEFPRVGTQEGIIHCRRNATESAAEAEQPFKFGRGSAGGSGTHPMLNKSVDAEEGSWQDWRLLHATSNTSSNGVSPCGSIYENTTAPSSEHGHPPVATGGHKKTQYHKTKLCPWHREGKCFMGDACNYAHSRDELRPKPDLSKTKLCPEMVKGRRCDRQGCRFAHDYVELRATSTFYKTRICKFWQRGVCPAGEECRHAHGRDDLRPYTGPTTSANTSIGSEDSGSLNSSLVVHPEWQAARGGLHVGPAMSSLPSPSFMSTTACTPTGMPGASAEDETLLAPILQQCAELLNASEGGAPPGDTMGLLRSWISEEVNRQWQAKMASTTPSPPVSPLDESRLLPETVLQGLHSLSPVAERRWEESSPTTSFSPSFLGAVQSLLAATQSKQWEAAAWADNRSPPTTTFEEAQGAPFSSPCATLQ